MNFWRSVVITCTLFNDMECIPLAAMHMHTKQGWYKLIVAFVAASFISIMPQVTSHGIWQLLLRDCHSTVLNYSKCIAGCDCCIVKCAAITYLYHAQLLHWLPLPTDAIGAGFLFSRCCSVAQTFSGALTLTLLIAGLHWLLFESLIRSQQDTKDIFYRSSKGLFASSSSICPKLIA